MGNPVWQPSDDIGDNDGRYDHWLDSDISAGRYYEDISFDEWIQSICIEDFMLYLWQVCNAEPWVANGMMHIGCNHELPVAVVKRAAMSTKEIEQCLRELGEGYESDDEESDPDDNPIGRWRWVD